MQVKFLRTVMTYFGEFNEGETYDLTDEQHEQLSLLNPDEIELVGESVAD